jgi:hypothetical protein
LLSGERSGTFTRMSLMSQSSGPIAPESRRLLREARRMKRAGFDKAAEQIALAASEQKLKEPSIGSAEQRIFARNLAPQLEQARIQASQAESEKGLEGRIGFAESIEKRAADLQPGENLYEKTLAEAPKFGVTPAELTGFFKRRGLSFATTPKTV